VKVVSKKANIETVNLSVYALYSNLLITKQSLAINPIIGLGLGSYELTYRKNIDKLTSRWETPDKSINMYDANSLLFRLLSETGLLGLALFLIFIFKYNIFKKGVDIDGLWVINNSILAFFIIRLIRVGHYFTDGFFLFFWIYYFVKIESEKGTAK